MKMAILVPLPRFVNENAEGKKSVCWFSSSIVSVLFIIKSFNIITRSLIESYGLGNGDFEQHILNWLELQQSQVTQPLDAIIALANQFLGGDQSLLIDFQIIGKQACLFCYRLEFF